MANNYPAIRPTLSLDMCNGIYVDPRVTFTRAGTRTYFGQEVVKAEENLLLHSQEFDNAYWTKTSTTLSADSAAAPDGTTTADLLYPSSTGVNRLVSRATNIGATASTQYTLSVYAKASGINFLYFGTFSGNTTDANMAFFDLGTGAVGQTGAFFSSASITAVGDGWYRCVATGTTATASMFPIFGVSDASGDGTVTASGTDGVLIWQAQLEQRAFVTAPTVTTTQPITRYQRLLKTAAANEWPREFDPVTGECLGRSVWEARTNLLLRSEEFDNASWTKTGSSVLANQIIAPDGTLTADKLVEDTSTGLHRVAQSVTVASGFRTGTVFVKAAERTFARIVVQDSGDTVINLTTGTFTASVGVGSVTDAGNGWWRISIARTTTFTTPAFRVDAMTDATTSEYTGDGTSGIYIWGAQLEAGAFATPYIPTVAAQVTRLADSAVMTGVNFSSWFNPSEGTLFVEAAPVSAAQNPYAAVVQQDNLSTNYISLAFGTNNSFEVGYNGVTQAATTVSGAISSGVFTKSAGSYKVNDFRSSADGVLSAADTSGLVAANVNNLKIGAFGVNSRSIYIKRLTYYNQAFTAANHQAVTR